MREIRIHGRGGQGAVMAAHMLGMASVAEGKYASSFPMFGVERRGAPVTSFLRLDEKPVREKTMIYSPDCLIILDPSQINLPSTFNGIKPGGVLVVNTDKILKGRPHDNINLLAAVNATKIAMEEIGLPIINTCILGAFVEATGWVKLDYIIMALEEFFTGKRLEANINSCRRGFQEVEIMKL